MGKMSVDILGDVSVADGEFVKSLATGFASISSNSSLRKSSSLIQTRIGSLR
jgi:hypothetical protein